mgnify:FL=1
MPAIGAAILAWYELLTVWQVIGYIVTLASMAYTLTNRPEASEQQQQNTAVGDGGQQANTSLISAPLPLIYGQTRVGINRVYVGTSGTDNSFLHTIANICEGEIQGLVQAAGIDQFFLNDKIYTDYGSNVYYEFFNGSPTQIACATLHTAIPEWNERKKRTAYIYTRYSYNRDIFQNIPDITALVQGLKIYNPATGITAYSNNPALCALDFLTSSSRRGGMGFNISRIDLPSVIDAAAYCDAKGWTCNLYLNQNQSASDNFLHILATFRGALVYSGSTFKLKYKDLNYESVVMNFTEDDVVEQGTSTLRIIQPSIFNTPNAVNCKYPNTENNYQFDDYILVDNDAIAADGDYREEQINLYGMTNLTNVQKMANYFLEKLRLNKNTSFITGSRAIPIEPMDLVTLTHSRPGWNAKVFRVASPAISYDGTVALSLEEEFASMYDDIYNLTNHVWKDTTLPDPSAAVPSVINVTHDEETYNYRDRTFTRWRIFFDRPLKSNYPWWDYADIYIKVGAGEWKFMTKSDGDYQVDPVQEGITYYCKIVSVSIFGTKQAFADGYEVSKNIVGKTALPSAMTPITALAHGDNVSVYGTKLSDTDISIYELRLGDAWAGGLFMGSNETPNFRLVGVRPGTHTFWMAAKDNAGNYSEIKASAVVTVFYPANYVDKHTWAWDFNGIGTFDNTEYVLYNTAPALKCSHTGGVLTGTWLSPEYDMLALKTVRVWGDFLTVFASLGGTWAALFPGATLWSDKTTAQTRWYELLSPEYAGALQARLYWGSVTGQLTEIGDKLEILAPEISARFLQVKVTITDPDAGSNLYLKTLNMRCAYWV